MAKKILMAVALAVMGVNEDKSHAVVFVLGLDKDGEKHVSLKLSGLADGEKYKITEINCDTPHDAKFDGRSLDVTLHGPYDSAVFVAEGDRSVKASRYGSIGTVGVIPVFGRIKK